MKFFKEFYHFAVLAFHLSLDCSLQVDESYRSNSPRNPNTANSETEGSECVQHFLFVSAAIAAIAAALAAMDPSVERNKSSCKFRDSAYCCRVVNAIWTESEPKCEEWFSIWWLTVLLSFFVCSVAVIVRPFGDCDTISCLCNFSRRICGRFIHARLESLHRNRLQQLGNAAWWGIDEHCKKCDNVNISYCRHEASVGDAHEQQHWNNSWENDEILNSYSQYLIMFVKILFWLIEITIAKIKLMKFDKRMGLLITN